MIEKQLGIIEGTRVYIETTRTNGANMSGARKVGYYAFCAGLYPVAVAVDTGLSVARKIQGGLERK